MTRTLLLTILCVGGLLWNPTSSLASAEASPAHCYHPVVGGWTIRISSDEAADRPEPGSRIGIAGEDVRLHRRPLFPPADRSMIWDREQMETIRRYGFRPLVLAYNEPRFLFDYHSAGGLLGHLYIGLTNGRSSKWLHQWEEIDVSYIDGRMEYRIEDSRFPGVTASLSATALSNSAGLIVKVSIAGLQADASLTWAYGGASAFLTNYNMTAHEFSFRPNQSMRDYLSWTGVDTAQTPPRKQFTLRRPFDKKDVYMQEVFAAARYLKDWEAKIQGGSSWQGMSGLGDPRAFAISPAQVAQSAKQFAPSTTGEERFRVAVEEIPLGQSPVEGTIAIGMGGNIQEVIRDPAAGWQAALSRNRSIADRIVTRTPDPYLDAAMRMMAFSTEGTWGDTSILHGAWSWRFAYLGWRGWYGPTCYGWTDRIKKSIQNQSSLGLILDGEDMGALGALLEVNPGVYYNMNEVFIDQVRHYFDYTNDLDLMRKIFPILKGILEWQNRRLQPGGEYLYENSLNTWISDSHWYIGGQCTQSSAYMYRAHSFLADLAGRLGEDPEPFRERAANIRAALQEKLWMDDRGVFAEYLDTRGYGLLHPEPELPTIYHSAEFGVADPEQIVRMLEWVDANLKTEDTPGGGKLVWSSNWFPNRGRSYTHSTHELAYAEELNYALTNYLTGRADEAYSLLRGTLCGMFNGPTPGGLSCHCNVDGTQRANDEFADALSMWGRTVVEGLFGILPKKPDGYVELVPQLPTNWPEASISTPHLSYELHRRSGVVSIKWESPEPTSLRLRLPLLADAVEGVAVDERPAEFEVEDGAYDLKWVMTRVPKASGGTLEVRYSPGRPRPVERKATEEVHSPSGKVWTAPAAAADLDLQKWTLVDLGEVYNAGVTEVLQKVTEEAKPPEPPSSQVGFNYWKDHLLQYHGSRNQPISDMAWREKVGENGVAWTTDGIPFSSSREGKNIAAVTRAGGFPDKIEFPVGTTGEKLYLMISGMTFPVQSHVVNLRVTLEFADGSMDDDRSGEPL